MTAASTLERQTATTVSVIYLIPAFSSFYLAPPVILDHVPNPAREADGEPKAFAFYYEGDGSIVLEDGNRPLQGRPTKHVVRTATFFVPSMGELLTAQQVAVKDDISLLGRRDILEYMEQNMCDHVFVFGPEGDKHAYKFYDGADQEVTISV